MAEAPRPLTASNAPDPSRSYERSRPEDEAGVGRMDNNSATPAAKQPDRLEESVSHAQPSRQINAHDDIVNERATVEPGATPSMPPPAKVDHSMFDEEPLGWDQAPNDIKDPQQKRHPKTEGKGGTE